MTFQPGANLYTQGFGSRPENVEVPHIDVRAPNPTDILYPIGKNWVNQAANNVYELTSQTSGPTGTVSVWTLLGAGAGDLNTLTTQDLTVVIPTAGNINLSGASPLSTTGSGSTATINLSGIVGVAHGGTGLATVTIHDLVVGNGTSPMTIITNGTTGQTLVAATGADPAWGVAGVPGGGTGAATLTGIVTGNGTSAMTANAVTEHGVLIGGAANAASSLGVASTGTLLAGVTGADPAFTASPSVTGSVTAGTTLTATLGDITATNGNLVLGTAGNKLQIHATTAASDSVGTSAVLDGASPSQLVVSTTAVTAASKIFLTVNATGGTPGFLSIGTIVPNTSFQIISSANGDTSTVNYLIIN